MTDYTPIMEILDAMVPLPRTLGARFKAMGPGWCETVLEPREDIANHIGTLHAGALFTLGEMASGGAMASVFADQMGSGDVVPLAAAARIEYLKVAKGAVSARAEISSEAGKDVSRLPDMLAETGRVAFPVSISIRDESGEETSHMTVDWHVRLKKTS